MTGSPHAAHPEIPGYTYRRELGAGGYSRVYLYEQHMPRREVAVKVMDTDVAGSSASRFESEANLMAKVSSHPAILSVFGAGVSSDGRPFIVMEYCPPPQLGMRLRQKVMTIPETLDTAIRIAGAVETAHRAGIIHRDIKPANILFTLYRRPVLADFGISAMTGPRDTPNELRGMSVPWAPPEQLVGSSNAEPATDVYSLAATVYAMLTGHSPFETPGSSEGVYELARRIVKDAVPPLGRPDVPPSLVRVLTVALEKDPARRYPTMLSFARALQQIQGELGLPTTAVDLYDDGEDEGPDRAPLDVDDPEATRLGVFSRVEEPVVVPADSRPPAVEPEEPHRPGISTRLVAGAAVVVLVAVIAGAIYASRVAQDSRPSPTFATLAPGRLDPLGATVPTPNNLQGAVDANGQVVFTWEAPEEEWSGDYLYRSDVAGKENESRQRTNSTSASLPAQEGSTCIAVFSRRQDGRTSEAARACVPTP